MGAVDEMLRRRERREPGRRVSGRKALWNALLAGATAMAFMCGGLLVIPEVGSRWLAALLWAGYGALFSAATFALVVAMAPLRRSRSVWPAIRIATFVTIYGTTMPLVPASWGSPPGLVRMMASAMIAAWVTALIDTAVKRRSRSMDAARWAEVF